MSFFCCSPDGHTVRSMEVHLQQQVTPPAKLLHVPPGDVDVLGCAANAYLISVSRIMCAYHGRCFASGSPPSTTA
jgi:hypothetical protein